MITLCNIYILYDSYTTKYTHFIYDIQAHTDIIFIKM